MIDGWSLDYVKATKRNAILTVLRGGTVEDGAWRRLYNSLKGLKMAEIGIQTLNGCKWVKWFDVEVYNILGSWDVCRLLAKGAKFRVCTKRPKLDDFNRSLLSQLLDGKVSEAFTSNMFYGRKSYLEWLDASGWVIRKDDKTNRMVVCSEEWERAQISSIVVRKCEDHEVLNYEGKLDYLGYEIGPRLYFLPKTHKSPRGRPIVAYTGKPRYAYLIQKKLEARIKELSSLDWKSTDGVVDVIYEPFKRGASIGTRVICGDIKDMFTRIPREELLYWVKYDCPSAYGLVFQHLQATAFKFYEDYYCFEDGVDMGSHVSPVISRYFVSVKEHYCKLSSRVYGARYVDDVQFVVHKDGICGLKSLYEEVIRPLEIEWKDVAEVMDTEFTIKDRGGKAIASTRYVSRGKTLQLEGLPLQVRKATEKESLKRMASRYRKSGSLSTGVFKHQIVEGLSEYLRECPHEEEDLFGALKYLGFDHSTGRCRLCKLMSEKGRVGIKGQRIELVWHPVWDSRKGFRLKERMRKYYLALGIQINFRWKVKQRTVMSFMMSKTEPWRIPKVTDEETGGSLKQG